MTGDSEILNDILPKEDGVVGWRVEVVHIIIKGNLENHEIKIHRSHTLCTFVCLSCRIVLRNSIILS